MQRTMLTTEQESELIAVQRQRQRHGNAALARRARCVLLWSQSERRVDIRDKLACNDGFVSRRTTAYAEQGLPGLVLFHPGRAPKRPTAKLEARVLNHTLKREPRDGSTHWSSRKLAAELGDVSFSAVQRIWRKHGVRPHRLDTHMVSNDPDVEAKAADVIGLYLESPAHAAVFCVDEKTAIQALDRKDRMLPLSPGRAQSHGFEYKRLGTLSLFAALNTATGEVLGQTAARHTSLRHWRRRGSRRNPSVDCGRAAGSVRASSDRPCIPELASLTEPPRLALFAESVASAMNSVGTRIEHATSIRPNPEEQVVCATARSLSLRVRVAQGRC